MKWIWPDPRGNFDGPVVVAKVDGEIVYMSYVVMPSAWNASR